MLLLLVALLACLSKYPVAPTTPAPVEAAAPELPAITYSPLEERLEAVYATSTDADQRDRLSNLRELLYAMRSKDPLAQRRVYDYADRALKIEERGVPQALPMDEPLVSPIIEAPLTPSIDPVAVLAQARADIAQGNYDAAITALAPLTSADAMALRREAVDTWARTEREAAGADFLTARALPPSPERTAALTAIRDRLAAINGRFPDNAYQAAIAENVAKVQAELTP